MEFHEAMREVEREYGFWAHLTAFNGRDFSWKRFEEAAEGKWGTRIIDEGNAIPLNEGWMPPWFPWAARISGVGKKEYLIGGGNEGFFAQILSVQDRVFTWRRIKYASQGTWLPADDVIEVNGYEANGLYPKRLPWNVRMVARSVPGEFMFDL